MQCKKEQNAVHCNYSYAGCPRKGICCECIAYHREHHELPACYFDDKLEKSYDRSIKAFIEANSQK